MASLKLLGVFLLCALLVAHVRADAEADAEADPEADPAGCCSRPTTFVKGNDNIGAIKKPKMNQNNAPMTLNW